jgi:hypothetical protein
LAGKQNGKNESLKELFIGGNARRPRRMNLFVFVQGSRERRFKGEKVQGREVQSSRKGFKVQGSRLRKRQRWKIILSFKF